MQCYGREAWLVSLLPMYQDLLHEGLSVLLLQCMTAGIRHTELE